MAAVCRAFVIDPPTSLADAVAEPISLNAATLLMPLYHPSRTVLNTIRSLEAQKADWRKVRPLLERERLIPAAPGPMPLVA